MHVFEGLELLTLDLLQVYLCLAFWSKRVKDLWLEFEPDSPGRLWACASW